MRAAAIFGLRSSWKDVEPFAREGAIITQAGTPPAKADAVLIFGGDGTVNRHLPKLLEHEVPTLVVPAGSGNDFARAIGFANVEDTLSAWHRFVRGEGNVRAVDVGVISTSTTETRRHGAELLERHLSAAPRERSGITTADHVRSGITTADRVRSGIATAVQSITGNTRVEPTTRLFCCVGGAGFDSETNRRANALPSWMRAHGGYVIAAARTLATWKPIQMKVELPDKGLTLDEPTSFVVFANAPSYGDGMRIAPHAVLDDGLLDVCFVRGTSRARITRHFASIYSGSHLSLREVEYFQVSRLRVETEQPIDVYADGEYMCRTPIDVSVRPKAFKVIC
jgi:diacylglycerol kinase (ATP)